MSDNEQKYHEYDGIIEHDNPMPTWWLWTFFLTIIFAFLYYIHYELAGGPTLQDELKVAMTEINQLQSKASTATPLETEDSLAAAFAKDGIFMNAVDTGWVTDEDPAQITSEKQRVHDFQPPLDIVDGAARICDPFIDGINSGKHWCGQFLKDYKPIDW